MFKVAAYPSYVQWRGEGSFTGGALEDMLRKAQDMGISLHWSPFKSDGNLESGRGGGLYARDFKR